MTDAYIDERFPDEPLRAKRRARLHETLDAYLDAGFVEAFQGDGWARATRDDINKLSRIFDEIIALKFSRDCDGDRSVDYAIAPRHEGRLVATMIPHEPRMTDGRDRRDLTEDEQLEHVNELMRAHNYLTGTASDLARQIEHRTFDMVRSRKAAREFAEKVAALRARIEAKDGDIKELAREIDALPGDGEASKELQRLYRTTFYDVFGQVEEELVTMVTEAGNDPEKVRFVREQIERRLPTYGHFGLARAVNAFNSNVRARRTLARTDWVAKHGKDKLSGFYSAYEAQDPELSTRDLTAEFRKPKPTK